MLLMLNLMISFMFMFLNHPMSMGVTLLLQTILVALITGMITINFWFSYILFLIMVGGMLVLFIYMTSIASNEMFSYSKKIMLMMAMLLSIFTSMYMLLDKNLLLNNYMYLENLSFSNLNFNLIKYFNYPSMAMIFFMIIYLFITLIAIVKITKIEYGPLRQKF